MIAGGRSEFLSFPKTSFGNGVFSSKQNYVGAKPIRKPSILVVFFHLSKYQMRKKLFFFGCLDLLRQIHQSRDHFRKANIFIWLCLKLEMSGCFSFIRISFPSLHHYALATGGDLLTIAGHSWKTLGWDGFMGCPRGIFNNEFSKKHHLGGWRWSNMKNLSNI